MDSCTSGFDTLAKEFPDDSSRGICYGHNRDNTLNVLIIAETGVDKSTWINGIANYVEYATLDAAQLSNNPKCVIPSRFTIYDDEFNEQIIFVGYPDGKENEQTKVGEACTMFPQAYEFMWRNQKVRFINTPGFGDSRALPQDMINLAKIFRYIKAYPIENLSAIIILMKPNQKVFTPAFTYCTSELFTRLPKNCAKNVLFCFTSTRPFCYQTAETLAPLRQFLATIEERQNVSLKVSKDTSFCFDNEAFRFLFASLPENGIDFTEDDRRNYASSWDQLVKETQRFLECVSSLPPYAITDIIALNDARQYISMLSKPLALISDMIEIINENIKRLLDKNGDTRKVHEIAIERLQATSKEYKDEKEGIMRIAAMFGAFLNKSAIMSFNDAVEEYTKLSIQQAENMAEMTQNQFDIEHVEILRDWVKQYKQQKQYIETGSENGCTASEVKAYCEQLLNLKHSGYCIKEIFECEKRGMENQEKHIQSSAQSHSASNQKLSVQGKIKSVASSAHITGQKK